ncbi:hypothetical protein AOD72_00450 [Klebsiella pneumoniae subsp. pneumoniae]|nr:hypothetical protein [Klebsiella pneumoniae]AMV49458.1 hypothetical protein AOD72_00450 [Klebsiella pneumoniae subsp. pneumoniae]
MVNELKEKADIRGPILQYNHYLKPEIFNENGGPLKLSEMLLFREFMRRPKRTNSLETQGLVQVGYQGLEKIHKMPVHWQEKGLTLDDWKDFLKVTLDLYVRVLTPKSWTVKHEAHRSGFDIQLDSDLLISG